MGDLPLPPLAVAASRAADGGVFVSEDPRDIGWVKQNVPCQHACPAGTNVPSYIRASVESRYGSSYEINREANVLPGVLGRVCSRTCEDACRHGWPGNGDPVAICHLKRVAADLKDAGHRITERLYAPTGKRVAIVGAGPAGVAAVQPVASNTASKSASSCETRSCPGSLPIAMPVRTCTPRRRALCNSVSRMLRGSRNSGIA